jgi:hypothetical protein
MTNGGVLIVLGVIFLLAYLIESLVESLVGEPFNHVPEEWAKFKWMLRYVAVAVGVTGAFVFQFDLLYICGQFLASVVGDASTVPATPFGIAITGAAIGQGASYLHDAISRYFKKPEII